MPTSGSIRKQFGGTDFGCQLLLRTADLEPLLLRVKVPRLDWDEIGLVKFEIPRGQPILLELKIFRDQRCCKSFRYVHHFWFADGFASGKLLISCIFEICFVTIFRISLPVI